MNVGVICLMYHYFIAFPELKAVSLSKISEIGNNFIELQYYTFYCLLEHHLLMKPCI